MSTRLNNMTSEELSELLLDYAKGRLDEAGMIEVKQAAANSDEVAAELALYEGLSKAGSQIDQNETTPGELGWARLSRSIDQHEAAEQLPIAANDNKGKFWRYATFALGFIVLGQVGFQFVQTQQNGSEDNIFVPVEKAVPAFASQVIFKPAASEVAIRQLLLESKAQIVSGPSSIGLYEVVFENEEARTAGLDSFQQASDIIESANRAD